MPCQDYSIVKCAGSGCLFFECTAYFEVREQCSQNGTSNKTVSFNCKSRPDSFASQQYTIIMLISLLLLLLLLLFHHIFISSLLTARQLRVIRRLLLSPCILTPQHSLPQQMSSQIVELLPQQLSLRCAAQTCDVGAVICCHGD